MINLKIRPLEITDYDKGYLNLLSQLTTVGEINKDKFEENFNKLPECHKLFVIEDVTRNTIVSMGTLVVETKFIHNQTIQNIYQYFLLRIMASDLLIMF